MSHPLTQEEAEPVVDGCRLAGTAPFTQSVPLPGLAC